MKKIFKTLCIMSLFSVSASHAGIITVEFKKEIGLDNVYTYHLRYLNNKNVIAERSYRDGKTIYSKGNIPDGMVIENYEDGKVKNILFFENERRNGPVVGFYPSGKIKIQSYYKDGNPDGMGYYYYENGNIMEEWNIKNGEEIYHREYYEDGTIKKQ